MTENLANMLRIILNAEFGNWTQKTIIRAGCKGTYWHDASILLEAYYKSKEV